GLGRSREVYGGLGFRVDRRFSDPGSVCVVVSPTICVMLLPRARLAEPHARSKAVHCLSADSPAEVDRLVDRALAGGGSPWRDKVDGCGMYGHSFADPDGHAWELLHLDCGPLGRSGPGPGSAAEPVLRSPTEGAFGPGGVEPTRGTRDRP